MTNTHGLDIAGIEDWVVCARDLLHECLASTACEEEDRLRDVIDLLCNAPISLSGYARLPQSDSFEALLACGGTINAAMLAVDENAPFILSRGANGICLVSMVQPGAGGELTAEAHTVSLALLSALLTVLIACAEQSREAVTAAAKSAASGARIH